MLPVKNIELNPGGIIGAIVCGSIAALLLYLAYGDAPPTGGGGIKLFFLGLLIGGAFVGNFLWECIFKKHK